MRRIRKSLAGEVEGKQGRKKDGKNAKENERVVGKKRKGRKKNERGERGERSVAGAVEWKQW